MKRTTWTQIIAVKRKQMNACLPAISFEDGQEGRPLKCFAHRYKCRNRSRNRLKKMLCCTQSVDLVKACRKSESEWLLSAGASPINVSGN